MEKFNTILTILTFFFTIYTYFKHESKIKKQERKINEYELLKINQEQVDSKKAIIEAHVNSDSKSKRKINVYNKGKAIAKNVIVHIPENEGFFITVNPFPIDIKPQQGFSIIGVVDNSSPEKTLIKFEWSDDFQEKNSDSQMIQL